MIYDDLVTQFWDLPLGILDFLTIKLEFSEDEVAFIRQFAKETQPSFERLFPDPAPPLRRNFYSPLLRIMSRLGLGYNSENADGDGQHFVERKKRLNFYANFTE